MAPWTAAHQSSLSFTVSQSLLKLMPTESMRPSHHFILCCPLLLLPSIFPSIRVFSSELALHIRWPKYWKFSFSISPSNEYSELISFRIDCFDLLAVQGNLKSPIPQFESINSSVLSLLYDPISHLYMATGENMVFIRQTFVRKVMPLLLKTLSGVDIALSFTCHYLSTICLLIHHLCTYVSTCISLIVCQPIH